MFIGTYKTSIGENGKVFVNERLSENYNIGDKYTVLIDEEPPEDEFLLRYRFNGEPEFDEKVVAEYVVGPDKMLKIPDKFLSKYNGECNVVGVLFDIEISTKGFYERKRASIEDIEKMISELDF